MSAPEAPQRLDGPDGLRAAVGRTLGTSPWIEVDQARVDRFADATDDHQWIHVDPARAATGPFGGTVAHGYLTLSLLPSLARQNYRVLGARMALNYGLDKVRFPASVPVGARIRARTDLVAVTGSDTAVTARFRHTVELEASERPACVAEMLIRYAFDSAVRPVVRQ